MTLDTTRLALVLHAHQPVGNFDHVIEEAYQRAYLPFVTAAEERSWLRFTLHFSGALLDWLAARHPEYIAQLQGLRAAGRVELLGGGYYEPILAAIPAAHQREQLRRLADAVERHFGQRPRGAWLAERVWEPNLASVLARAGVEYTVLDDAHFERAGIPADDLHGYWLTEDQSETLAVVPSNYFLRQAIPFQPVEASMEFLARHPGQLLTMGDDLEKFGSWPQTFAHVYGGGWLERFFDALEARHDQIVTVRLDEALTAQSPRGLVYLPTGSYPEMMAWAGSANWRSFFTKYREANLLHKTLEDLASRLGVDNDLLAAECNDVYWHGWFGGLYSPHLRNLAFTHLLAADATVEWPEFRRWDLFRDGSEVIELRSPQLRLLLAARTGEILELDARTRHANLVNTMARRPEPYHDALRRREAPNPANLPGGGAATNSDLAAALVYDNEPKTTFEVVRAQAGKVEIAAGETRRRFRLHGDTLTVEGSGGEFTWRFNLLAPDAEDRGIRHAGERRSLRWEGELGPGPLVLEDGWRLLRIELRAEGADGWRVTPLYTVSQAEAGFEAVYQGSELVARWPPGTQEFSTQMKIFLD